VQQVEGGGHGGPPHGGPVSAQRVLLDHCSTRTGHPDEHRPDRLTVGRVRARHARRRHREVGPEHPAGPLGHRDRHIGVDGTPALEQAGVSRERFLQDVDYFLGTFRQQRPELFTGYTSTFDAPSLARAMFAQYVTPMRELNQLFTTHPKLTRLFTTLSPADMTRDPVFSFNATLPDVPREHTAKLKMGCGSSTLVTEQGVELQVVGQQLSRKATPKALRIETVLEEGAPTVMTDNASAIVEAYKPAAAAMTPPMQGCSVVDPTSLGLLVLVAKLRRQRKGTRS